MTRPDLCAEDELDYARSRTRFEPGTGLVLDDGYRLAHLPLVAPGHPKVIRSEPGTFYEMGRHPRVFSLALPIPVEALERSGPYRELEAELRGAPFGPKIAWDVVETRRDRLHATICGQLSVGEPPPIGEGTREALARLGPVEIELRGLFSGNVNRGRFYLRVYPERRGGENLIQAMQQVMGRPVTSLYVVGIWNLRDDLDATEAAALSRMIERWWDRPILRFQAESLWLLGAKDDLVLDFGVSEVLPLVKTGSPPPQLSSSIASTRSG